MSERDCRKRKQRLLQVQETTKALDLEAATTVEQFAPPITNISIPISLPEAEPPAPFIYGMKMWRGMHFKQQQQQQVIICKEGIKQSNIIRYNVLLCCV
jgi:hypothetical protein